jgi:hypothetical protein
MRIGPRFAPLVAAAALSLPGCPNNTSSADMSAAPDLTAPAPDLSVNPDLTALPDQSLPLANGQLTLQDVGGTFYRPGATAGSEQPLPFSHFLLAQQSLPMYPMNPQYIDSDFSLKGGMVHGCTSNRYSLPNGPLPNADVNAGVITYKGYSTNLFAADARTPPAQIVYSPPIPDTIACLWGGASFPFYGCIFGFPSTDMQGNVDGESPSQVLFPAYPAIPPLVTTAGTCTAGTTAHTGPFGPGGSTLTLCEQHPIPDGAMLTQNMTGGGGYGALSNEMVPVAGGIGTAMTIISVNGAVPASPIDPFAGITLDGSSDLTIQWSCDGSATAGSGCPMGAIGFLDLAGLAAITSTSPRSAFTVTADYGVAQCTEQLGSGTVTLKKAAIVQLLGAQTGGSILLTLARLAVDPGSTMGHGVFFTGGKGYFALLQH